MTPGVIQVWDPRVPEADAVNAMKMTRRQPLEDWPVCVHRPKIGVPRLGDGVPPGPNSMRWSITATPRGDLALRHQLPQPNQWTEQGNSVQRSPEGSTKANRRRGSWALRPPSDPRH